MIWLQYHSEIVLLLKGLWELEKWQLLLLFDSGMRDATPGCHIYWHVITIVQSNL